MRHRIVQHGGRRYSLKLDDVVWQALEAFAGEQGLRRNELIARIDRDNGGRSSLTEAIRLYCLKRAMTRIGELERRVERLSLTGGGVPLGLIVDACAVPCILLAQDHTIRRLNPAAQRWMGAGAESLTGRSVLHYLQLRSEPPLPEIMTVFARGEQATFPARVVYLRPGKVMMAKVTLCPAQRDNAESFSYLMLFEPA